jgi:hypothetical protein
MPNTFTMGIAGIGLFLSLDLTVRAESAHDRVALMLSGTDCPAFRQNVETALRQHPGVLQVDMDLVPDHVLIDYLHQQLTGDDLAAIANAAMANSVRCRAEVMKSCITAEMAPSTH